MNQTLPLLKLSEKQTTDQQSNDVSAVKHTEAQAHTPGPWEIRKQPGHFLLKQAGHAGEYLFDLKEYAGQRRAEANAHLIAAAPLFMEMARFTVKGTNAIAEALNSLTDNAEEWSVAEIKQHAQALRVMTDAIVAGNEAAIARATGAAS